MFKPRTVSLNAAVTKQHNAGDGTHLSKKKRISRWGDLNAEVNDGIVEDHTDNINGNDSFPEVTVPDVGTVVREPQQVTITPYTAVGGTHNAGDVLRNGGNDHTDDNMLTVVPLKRIPSKTAIKISISKANISEATLVRL